MTTLYDKILNRNFSGFLGKELFALGLLGRKGFFSLRNLTGSLLHLRRRSGPPAAVRRVLIVRTDRIGDIVLSTPALRAVRRRFPDAEIDYVVQERYASLLNCFEGWSTVYKFDLSSKEKITELGRTLRARRYDVAVVEHPAAYAYRLARAAGPACVIGWKAKGFGYLLDIGFNDDRITAGRHQVENNLRLFSPLGIADPDPTFPIRESETGKREFAAFLDRHGIDAGKRLFAVHPGSYSPRKRWLPERFGELLDRAAAHGLQPVLFGTEGERAVVERAAAYSRCQPVVSIGELGLEGVISLLRHTFIFVGNFTGPMHMAVSAGAWTIALFGDRYPMDNLDLWRPFSPKGIVVMNRNCRCGRCIPWTCKDMVCLTGIGVDDVWREIERILALPESAEPGSAAH